MSVSSQHAQILALFGVLGVVSGAIIYYCTKQKKNTRDEEIGVGINESYAINLTGTKAEEAEGLIHRHVTFEANGRKDSVKSKTLSAVIGSPTVEVTSKLEFPTSPDKPVAPNPPKVNDINEKIDVTVVGNASASVEDATNMESQDVKTIVSGVIEKAKEKAGTVAVSAQETMEASSKSLLEKANYEVAQVERQVNNMAEEVERTVAEMSSTFPQKVEDDLKACMSQVETEADTVAEMTNSIGMSVEQKMHALEPESNLAKHASIESVKIEQNLQEILAKELSPVPVKEEPSAGNMKAKKLVKGNSLLEILNVKHVNAIEDHFSSLKEISSAINMAGLEKSQLIFGIDFTISNLENGTNTFNGRSLHYSDETIRNPYQKVIEILGKTLETFDMDGRIPAFGFGDSKTKDRRVFPFSSEGYCLGFKDVLEKYNTALKNIQLSGPTNFAPLIREAIKIVKATKQYHILVIVADGQVTNERQTREAIVEASKHPISIIMVGVGDGPWDTMNEFDDSLPKRQFDNFQFVNYHEVIKGSDNPDEAFALHTLMEIPDQYKAIKDLNLLD